MAYFQQLSLSHVETQPLHSQGSAPAEPLAYRTAAGCTTWPCLSFPLDSWEAVNRKGSQNLDQFEVNM